MSEPAIIVGFPEMHGPVYEKYRLFFDSAAMSQPIVNEMIKRPVGGLLAQTVGRIATIAANTNGALLTLVLNGYGHDALKLGRSLFEMELNVSWLRNHPEDVHDFLEYGYIQRKKLYDLLSDDQKCQISTSDVARMQADYDRVFDRFADVRDKSRPRNEWCKKSLYGRAKEASRMHVQLYQTFYAQASSMHHVDVRGIIEHLDDEEGVDLAPSWSHLDDALISSVCSLRCLIDFDEIAGLGFKYQLEAGPGAAYGEALRALA